MNQTEQVQISLEPCVTQERIDNSKRYESLIEDFDILRNRCDIRYRGSHELTYTQKIQLKRVQEYEAELRRKYTK